MRTATRKKAERSQTAGRRADVLVIGGGIMGCACAWRLALDGAEVIVLERSVPGAEASSAAAGILGAQIEAHSPGPMVELGLKSREHYPRYSEALKEQTGIDIGFRRCGVLRVAVDRPGLEHIKGTCDWQKRQRLRAEMLDSKRTRALESELSPRVMGAVRFREDGRVDPPALLRALHIAAQRAGARFQTGAYVRRLVVNGDRASGVALDDGTILPAANVVVAAGSWTTLIEGLRLPAGAVRPARGQIVELETPAPLLSHVVFGPGCYLVPRDDGRLLVGSTLEFVGYRREVTAGAVRDLLSAALALVPALATATLRGSWANFRPYTDDELPLLGPSGVHGVTLATGHYRNGILLAPITAEIVAAVIQNKKPPVSLSPFSPSRALAGDASRNKVAHARKRR